MSYLTLGGLFLILDVWLLRRDYQFERHFGSKVPMVWRMVMRSEPPASAGAIYFWHSWMFFLVMDVLWIGMGLAEVLST